MSSFCCPKCGAYCLDTERGYITGCRHFPPDAPAQVIPIGQAIRQREEERRRREAKALKEMNS